MANKRLPPGMVKRGNTYHANFQVNGRRVRKRLSRDLRTATQLLTELRARAERGDFGLLDLDYPWADLKHEFLKNAQLQVRNPQDYERDLKQFEKFSCVLNVSEVTPRQIDAYRVWRLDQGVTPRTVNREVGTVRNMLNLAVRRNHIPHNLIAGVKPLPHENLAKQRRALTLAEVESLIDASPDYLKPVWRMFMTTGIRKSELVNMRFDDIDWDRQTVTVQAAVAKSKKAREIPLDDHAMGILVAARERARDRRPVRGGTLVQSERQRLNFTPDHVFVTQANTPLRNNLLRQFYACCKAAGIEDGKRHGSVDIHSLRVTFATLAIDNGANPKAVQKILGHSTLDLTMAVYTRTTDRAAREAINALPFASVTAPEHVLPIDAEWHRNDTSSESDSQVVAG